MPAKDRQLNKIICNMFGWGLNVKKRIQNTGLDLIELQKYIDEREKIAYKKGLNNKNKMTKKELEQQESYFADILADIYSDIKIIQTNLEEKRYKEALKEIKRLAKKFKN